MDSNAETNAAEAAQKNAIAEYYKQYTAGQYQQQYQQGGDYPHYGGYSGYGYGYGYQGGYNQGEASPLDAEIQVVMSEIRNELELLKTAGEYGEQFKNAKRLLTHELDRLENTADPEWLEVDIPKSIKLSKKVLIPSFRHPHFNFVGKVLGPRGQTLQTMAKQFKCHIYVLGRGSTKDRNKEQELLNSGDPQYAHYGGPLHVKVETIAPSHIAYQRISGVLESLSRTLLPVRDILVESQMQQLSDSGEGSVTVPSDENGASGSASSTGGRGGYVPSARGSYRGRAGTALSTFKRDGPRLGAPY